MFGDDVWRYLPFGPLPTFVGGVVGLGLLVAISLRPESRMPAAVLWGLTALGIVGLTLGGGSLSDGASVNLKPGAGIRAELDNVNHALGVVNVLGNVAIFVPLGWLTAVLSLHGLRTRSLRSLGMGVLAGFGLSGTIEAVQYFLGRSADVDDVLLNTVGAVLGAVIGVAICAFAQERSRRLARIGPP